MQEPVTDADWVAAHRANACSTPTATTQEFGYRYLLDEVTEAGQVMAARTAWAIC
jgi:hypothetical protein